VGKIMAQDPAAGIPAKKGTAVNITVSKGPDLVEVPDVVGKTQADADAALQDAGLTSRAGSSAFDPKVPAGSVVSQDPAKGDKIPRDSVVTYVLSLGAEQAVVPNVEGMSKSKATTKLQGAGFKVRTTSSSSSSVSKGVVISQDKSAGGAYPKGSTVTINVSTGPPLVKIPNVVGQAAAAAQTAIVDAGLKVVFTYNNVTASGLVTGQLPKAGKMVAPGTTVTLEIDGADPGAP
jgi:serine/threonine-protein kinase